MARKLTDKQEESAPVGRPTEYTPELGDLICAEISDKKSLAKICRENEELPSTRTIYTWLRVHPEFLQNYKMAKEDQADCYAEEIVEIADDSSNDYMDSVDDNGATGATRLNAENIQRSRLRVDARKWVASKLKSKVYGDKIQQEITAPEGVQFNMSFGGKNGS